MSASLSSEPKLDKLCKEVTAHIALFCDFPSLLRFSRSTSREIKQAVHGCDDFLWKEVFHRHRFPIEEEVKDYIAEIQRRRQLFLRLFQLRTKKQNSCFNLPNRCFHFVPITPYAFHFDDPPPVDFNCDSFMLTSKACSGELLFLHPLEADLMVYQSCVDNAVVSDETKTEEEKLLQSPSHSDGSPPWNHGSQEETMGSFDTAAFSQQGNNGVPTKIEPFQLLLQMGEDIAFDEYFAAYQGPHLENMFDLEVGYYGIDAKPIIRDKNIVGTMVAVGRMISVFQQPWQDERVLSEVIIWTRRTDERLYGGKKSVRLPQRLKFMDVCSAHDRCYAVFAPPEGPATHRIGGLGEAVSNTRLSTVVVHKLQPNEIEQNDTRKRKHSSVVVPDPEFLIQCQDAVSALSVDPTGSMLLVGTANGCIEMWSVETTDQPPKCLSIVDIKGAVRKAFEMHSSMNCGSSNARSSVEDHLKVSRVTSFHLPGHLFLEDCGFVTLQYTLSQESTLVFWESSGVDRRFEPAALIKLPLSPRQAPRVFFDGRRLVVFGMDDVGCIILVYYVQATREDAPLFDLASKQKGTGSSAIFNLTGEPKICLANRIRHAALGGLEDYDAVHITCNERYIVVNTKTGNLLGDGVYRGSDGLLVIDLEDECDL